MSLSESISLSLDGKKSGKGFRVPTICHNGTGKNLYLADGDNGKLIATCFSHGCEYKTIMLVLEAQGLKPKAETTQKQRQKFAQIKNKRELIDIFFTELHILLQFINDRIGDRHKLADRNYLKLHPEFQSIPEEPFEREKLAAHRVKILICEIYD